MVGLELVDCIVGHSVDTSSPMTLNCTLICCDDLLVENYPREKRSFVHKSSLRIPYNWDLPQTATTHAAKALWGYT